MEIAIATLILTLCVGTGIVFDEIKSRRELRNIEQRRAQFWIEYRTKFYRK